VVGGESGAGRGTSGNTVYPDLANCSVNDWPVAGYQCQSETYPRTFISTNNHYGQTTTRFSPYLLLASRLISDYLATTYNPKRGFEQIMDEGRGSFDR